MVHNIADGLPVEAITTLNGLETSNHSLTFGFIGIEGFSDRVFRLNPYQIEALLGPAATDADTANLDNAALRELIQHLRHEADSIDFIAQDLRPVPPDKLNYNNLPNYWKLTAISDAYRSAVNWEHESETDDALYMAIVERALTRL